MIEDLTQGPYSRYNAHGQPDVYEVNTLPESDRNDHLPANLREHESLAARFQRIQTELHQLMNEASSVKEQCDAESKDLISVSELCCLSESLSKQLQELRLNSLGNTRGLNAGETNSKSLFETFLKKVDDFQPGKLTNKTGDAPDHLVYEIYNCQRLPKQFEAEKLADIDRRIQRIEALIGQPDPGRLSALTADTLQHSLLEACSRLAARSSLFEPAHLDMIETRLTVLQNKLQSITEKREVIADFDAQNKIADLYELVKKWNDVADSIPMIVERLTTLKVIHEEASQFSESLKIIESNQSSISESIHTYRKLLNDVQGNAIKNIETIKENFSTLGGQ